jgi:hypothetical protein
VLLVGGGNLLRRLLRRRAAGTAIVAHVGDVVDDDGLVVDVGDLHVGEEPKVHYVYVGDLSERPLPRSSGDVRAHLCRCYPNLAR